MNRPLVRDFAVIGMILFVFCIASIVGFTWVDHHYASSYRCTTTVQQLPNGWQNIQTTCR